MKYNRSTTMPAHSRAVGYQNKDVETLFLVPRDLRRDYNLLWLSPLS